MFISFCVSTLIFREIYVHEYWELILFDRMIERVRSSLKESIFYEIPFSNSKCCFVNKQKITHKKNKNNKLFNKINAVILIVFLGAFYHRSIGYNFFLNDSQNCDIRRENNFFGPLECANQSINCRKKNNSKWIQLSFFEYILLLFQLYFCNKILYKCVCVVAKLKIIDDERWKKTISSREIKQKKSWKRFRQQAY